MKLKICLKPVTGWGGANKWAMDGALKCAWHPWRYRTGRGFHCLLQTESKEAVSFTACISAV